MPFGDVSTSNPDLLPIEWSREVIQQMAQSSAVLGLSRRLTMSTRQQILPATAALAKAYWVSGADSSGLKQTTKNEWVGVFLRVEELAALVPIPNAHLDDNAFPVWEQTRPSVVEAMGAALDKAVLFGVDKPVTWPDAIFPSIVAAGNTVDESVSTLDLAADIALAAQELKATGWDTSGFAVEPGFGWRLIGLRSVDGVPIYQTDLAGPMTRGLYGFPMGEVANGAWDSAQALSIGGDWSKSLVGIRQDISFSRHDSGVINDETGAVVFNAMQQDSTIWRAVFRVAWTRANPATRLVPNPDVPTGKFPWAAVIP